MVVHVYVLVEKLGFGILSFEIGIWGLQFRNWDLDLGHGIRDLRIKDLSFLCKIGI